MSAVPASRQASWLLPAISPKWKNLLRSPVQPWCTCEIACKTFPAFLPILAIGEERNRTHSKQCIRQAGIGGWGTQPATEYTRGQRLRLPSGQERHGWFFFWPCNLARNELAGGLAFLAGILYVRMRERAPAGSGDVGAGSRGAAGAARGASEAGHAHGCSPLPGFEAVRRTGAAVCSGMEWGVVGAAACRGRPCGLSALGYCIEPI